jgi:hypothetical protein
MFLFSFSSLTIKPSNHQCFRLSFQSSINACVCVRVLLVCLFFSFYVQVHRCSFHFIFRIDYWFLFVVAVVAFFFDIFDSFLWDGVCACILYGFRGCVHNRIVAIYCLHQKERENRTRTHNTYDKWLSTFFLLTVNCCKPIL